jgi:hypothetical protein
MTSSSGNFELEGVYSTNQFAGGCAHSIRQLKKKTFKKSADASVKVECSAREIFTQIMLLVFVSLHAAGLTKEGQREKQQTT